MGEMKQGENYEEQEVNVESTVKKDNRKIVIAVAALLVVVGVVSSIAVTTKIKAKEKREQEIAESVAQEEEELDAYWESVAADMTDPTVEEVSEDTIKELRKWGYTGDEIEQALKEDADTDAMIADAKKLRQEAAQEAMIEASPEYQNLLNSTWLGGEEIQLSSGMNVVNNVSEHKEVVDYVKCLPARGCQLFIKVTLDDGHSAFMYVTPERWNKLANSGNMVVSVSTIDYGGALIVTNLSEVLVE